MKYGLRRAIKDIRFPFYQGTRRADLVEEGKVLELKAIIELEDVHQYTDWKLVS